MQIALVFALLVASKPQVVKLPNGKTLTLRPYVPPKLEPEPAPEPHDWDSNILARPWYGAPMVGQILRGARVPVKGQLQVKNGRGCPTRIYYALEPFGWICSKETKKTDKPATNEQVLQLVEGTPVPYRYVMVGVATGTFLPMWADLAALKSHAEPERQLKKGDTIAIHGVQKFEGASYYVAVDDKVIPVKGTFELKTFSDWQGVEINDQTHLPFGWVTPEKAPVFDAPKGTKLEDVPRRTRYDILEEQKVGNVRWIRVGEGRWMKADHVNEVRKIDRPKDTGTNPQWFDVDLGEQVVVAYMNDKPVYATLTSSGREPNHTPRGNYPLWGKVTGITMKSQDYDDIPYYVNKVPWVLFFQAHNALHGAYWHDRFGVVKSHGCANLSPKDSKHLFEWIQPPLPNGWTAVRFWDLTQAPVAHVHNTHMRQDIIQERNIGPPDKADEAERVDEATARREAKERDEEAAKAAAGGGQQPQPQPGQPTPPPALAPSPAPPQQPH